MISCDYTDYSVFGYVQGHESKKIEVVSDEEARQLLEDKEDDK